MTTTVFLSMIPELSGRSNTAEMEAHSKEYHIQKESEYAFVDRLPLPLYSTEFMEEE